MSSPARQQRSGPSARRSSGFALALCLAFALSAAPVFAQEAIEPDRPDVTNGARLVGPRVVQFEVGGIYSRQSAEEHGTGSPIAVRVGVRDWIEARASWDGWISSTDAGSSVTGGGNIQLGAKIRIWPDATGQSRLSLLPTVNLPTASEEKGLGTGRTDFTLLALTGFDLGPSAHLDVNYGIGAIGSDRGGPRFVEHLASASLSASVGRWNPWGEAFVISRDHIEGSTVVGVTTGAIVLVNPRFALDGGVEFGVTEEAPSFAAFAGFSVALDRWRSEASRRSGRRSSRRRRLVPPPR